MKRILIFLNSSGAAITSRKEVLLSLKENGYDVHVSAPEDEYTSNIIEYGFHYIKTIMDTRGTNPIKDLFLLKRYINIIKDVKPDVILTYTIKPNVYGGIAARICGIPQIANITGLSDAIHNGGKMKDITTLMYRVGLNKAHLVFFQNRGDQKYCNEHGIGNKYSIVLPGSGVNISEFSLLDYLEDNNVVKFLFIGRFKKDKGIEEFLSMVECIKEKYPNVEFHALGDYDSNYSSIVERLINEGKLHYHGKTKNVRPFIENSHCLILPSYHEGMSNVLLESSSMGRPIITTNVHGCMEAVDDGENGYCVQVRDAKCLTEAVERFINLPYNQKKEMGLKGRKKMEREFDRNIVIKYYLEEIKKIIK